MINTSFDIFLRRLTANETHKGLSTLQLAMTASKLYGALTKAERSSLRKEVNTGLTEKIRAEARTLRIPPYLLRERWATTDVTKGVTERLKEIAASAGLSNLSEKRCHRYASPQALFLQRTLLILKQNNAIPIGEHRQVAVGMYLSLSQDKKDALLNEAKELNLNRNRLQIVPQYVIATAIRRGIPCDFLKDQWNNPAYKHQQPKGRLPRIARSNGIPISVNTVDRRLSELDKRIFYRARDLNIPYPLAKVNWYTKHRSR